MTDASDSPFLRDGGECGAVARATDWASTPVGPVEGWPVSLRSLVAAILHSRHPMFLFWGPDHVQFYNDAYLPSFGVGKHPAAMGQRGADCLKEIWPLIWPQIDGALREGVASWNEDQLIPTTRNGRLDDVYWTYGYSPAYGDDGSICGVLVVCTETTDAVVSRRRLRSLRRLADATTLATELPAVVHTAAEGLADSNPDDVRFALFYAADPLALVRASGLSPEAAAVLDERFRGRLSELADAACPSPLGDTWNGASDVFVQAIAGGDEPVIGYLLFGLNPRLPFDAAYREYLGQITEHVRLAKARVRAFRMRAVVERERDHLLEQAPIAVALLTGTEHEYQLANDRYVEMVGREVIGKTYAEAFPELVGTPLPQILDEVYATGEPFAIDEIKVPLTRGGVLEDRFFMFNLEPVRDPAGKVYGMMALAVDITAQVTTRKAVEEGHLERERLVKDLEEAHRTKDTFLAMLGHELRNPLSPIVTALELMRLRGVEGADRERAIIERQVRHMVNLVDDLLDVSRITRGVLELDRSKVGIHQVVSRAIEQASPLIDRRHHHLEVHVPEDLFVDGDLGRLAQVMSNLLTNAAKYTEPGGRIEVEARRDEDAVIVTVKDDGIGLEPDAASILFEAFTREMRDPAQGGLGLGLAIVKSLVDAHGGSVHLESLGVGEGTTCTIRLPESRGLLEARRPTPPKTRTPSTEGSRVLLVDDNEDAAELLAMSLRQLGHHVEVAFDATAAMQLAKQYLPDVALLDLGLPVIDGYELLSHLQAEEGWSGVRFVALTGYGQQSDRDRTEAAGFAAHLVKPIEIETVHAQVLRLRARGE